MHNVDLENKLIIIDIADAMLDYVSLQPDIDEQKVKSAELVAQDLDLKRIMGKDNVDRCVDPQTPEDDALYELVVPALCHYTYSRLLKLHQGTFTDSGFVVEGEAEDKNTAKSVSNEASAIAESYMTFVLEFLKEESGGQHDEDVNAEKLTPRIRVFGGKERRASN